MKIRVLIEREKKERIVKINRSRVGDLLGKLGINPESVIVAKGRDLLTGDAPLKDGEKLRIIHIKASD